MKSEEILQELRDAVIYCREDSKTYAFWTTQEDNEALRIYGFGCNEANDICLKILRKLSRKLHRRYVKYGTISNSFPNVRNAITKIETFLNIITPSELDTNLETRGYYDVLNGHYLLLKFLAQNIDTEEGETT